MGAKLGTSCRTVTLVCWLILLLAGALPGQESKDHPAQPEVVPSQPSSAQAEPAAAKKQELTLEDRADIFMARKSYADAADYYLRALRERDNKDPSLWNKLGIAYQQHGDYRAARRAYQKSIRHRKDFAEPWNNLGTTYFLQNKVKKSLKYYQRAVKLNPASASFHLNLGTAYYYRKKYPEAVEEYRTALSLDPNVLAAHSAVATVVQATRADFRYYFYIAKVFASLGRAEEAVRYLRRAFEDGFKDHKRIDEDPDFQKISEYPAYVELRNNPPVPIKD